MSTLKVDTIESKTINGDITVSSPLVGDGSGLTNLPSQTANDFTNTLKTKLDNVEANATADQTKTDIEALGIDISGTMSGHIIPGTNSVYDIGSAEYKVRHLFLSDNSLWVGDDHKVTVEGGKKKYKKRKKGIVPAGVQTLLITSVFADTAALLINFKAQIHDPAPSNELDPDHVDFNPPTSKWQEFLVLHGHPNKSVDDIYNTATDFDDEKEETDKATAEGDIVYFDGSVYRRLPLGSEGQVLLANGDGTAPEWAAGDRSDFVLLATKTGGAGTYDFASGDGVDHSIYSTYTFELSGVYPSTNDQVLWMRTSFDDGSTYASSTYLARLHSIDQAGLHEISGSSGTAVAIILTTTGVRTGTTQGGCSGTVKIPGQAAGNKVYTTSLLGWQQPTGADYLVGIASGNHNGAFPDSGGIDAYRFMFATGNINGTIKMYGAK